MARSQSRGSTSASNTSRSHRVAIDTRESRLEVYLTPAVPRMPMELPRFTDLETYHPQSACHSTQHTDQDCSPSIVPQAQSPTFSEMDLCSSPRSTVPPTPPPPSGSLRAPEGMEAVFSPQSPSPSRNSGLVSPIGNLLEELESCSQVPDAQRYISVPIRSTGPSSQALTLPGPPSQGPGPLVTRPPQQGPIRGTLRMEPYPLSQAKQKKKSFYRSMDSITKRLEQVARVHPEKEFIFYARTQGRRNVLCVSNHLRGIDTTSWFTVIHNAMSSYNQNQIQEESSFIAYEERFPMVNVSQMVSHEMAWRKFADTQNVKSMKAFYNCLQRNDLVRKRKGSPPLAWYLESFKPLFDPAWDGTTLALWQAFRGVQYNGSIANGRALKEFSRNQFVGLMKSLDLLAAARGEDPLPHDVDFSGNYLQNLPSVATESAVTAGVQNQADDGSIPTHMDHDPVETAMPLSTSASTLEIPQVKTPNLGRISSRR